MRRVLYLMHVDWSWIKQRPHFIAEELGEHFKIIVFYSYGKDRKKMKRNEKKIPVYPFFKFPLRKKYKLIRRANEIFLKTLFFCIIKINRINTIWITNPELHQYIPSKLSVDIIYDCMDDNISLENDISYKHYLKKAEKNLLKRSSKIFITSNNLRKKIIERYNKINIKQKIFLSRNAYNGLILNENLNLKKENPKIKLCYIGTISSWFDVDVLNYILKKNENIEIHIIGPLDIDLSLLEKNKQVKIYGTIKHDNLARYIKEMDILLMNFKVNDIILSVDPVKLYEYINFNKPIICIKYPEVIRFEEYVNFYQTKEEFYENILEIQSKKFKPKYSLEKRKSFLEENTWKNRAKEIVEKIGDRP